MCSSYTCDPSSEEQKQKVPEFKATFSPDYLGAQENKAVEFKATFSPGNWELSQKPKTNKAYTLNIHLLGQCQVLYQNHFYNYDFLYKERFLYTTLL